MSRLTRPVPMPSIVHLQGVLDDVFVGAFCGPSGVEFGGSFAGIVFGPGVHANVDIPPPAPDVVPPPHPVPPHPPAPPEAPTETPPEIIDPVFPGENAPVGDPIAPDSTVPQSVAQRLRRPAGTPLQ